MTGAPSDTTACGAHLKISNITMNDDTSRSRKGLCKNNKKQNIRPLSIEKSAYSVGRKVSPSSNEESITSSSKKSFQHFLSIDPKRRDSLINTSHERTRNQRTAKNERKSSVLKSLVVLDIDDKDDDYVASSLRNNLDGDSTHSPSSVDSSSTTGSGRRYMRRGSVTKHKLEADTIGMQPIQRVTDESDYGSDYDSGVEEAEKQRRRYLRRGSVTKHKLEADAEGMQPFQRASARAESDRGNDYDSGMDEAEEMRRRYLRRGSVTKYSLDYASIGKDMQPTEVVEGDAVMFKKGGVLVSKPRLPPPPSNDSFCFDDDEDLVKGLPRPPRKSASCHARMLSPDLIPKTPARKRSGRPSRRGSMKMPARQNLGDDYYSGNINDSGHHQKHLYFDSHEEAFSTRPTKFPPMSNDNLDTSASNHSVASMPPVSAVASHPIDPVKPRSGRKLIVDESELYSSCQDLDFDDHLDTIAPSTPFKQSRRFERGESSSSFESDESSESSFCNDYDDDFQSKLPARLVSRKPRLPPAYSSAPKKLVSSTSSPRKKWKKLSSRKSKGEINASGSVSSADDSTASSTRSEEDPALHKAPASKLLLSNYAGFTELKRRQDQGSTAVRKVKGVLCSDDKPATKTKTKAVRFDRIVITEFPVILGDNPAVTAGAPVTIDWQPQGERNYSINAYERCRPVRRRRRRLLISVSNRAILLLSAGYSIDEIADASINAQQIKFSRQESMNASQYRERVSLLMENTNDALNDMVQNTGKKLKALIAKPVQHSESARTA